MKLNELLAESISLSKYTGQTEVLLINHFIKSLDVSSSINVIRTNAPTIDQVITDLSTVFYLQLKNPVSKLLINFANSVIAPPGTLTSVEITRLSADVLGQAVGSTMKLSISFFIRMRERYQDILTDLLPKNIVLYKKNSNDVDTVCNIVSSNKFMNLIKSDLYIGELLLTLVDIFLHEMVHIIQAERLHISAYKNKKELSDINVHKSYLSDKKLTNDKGQDEFLQKELDDEHDDRWKKLYYADAREITAYAHNFVQSLMRKYKPANNKNWPSLNLIARDIPEMVKQLMTPTTSTELKVYNRYLKLIYQELERAYSAATQTD